MEQTDKDLIFLYFNGQVDALEQLVEKYQRPLFGYIYNMTEGREDAEEIFQEVWFRAIKKLGNYSHNNFGGWLIRIAHNYVIDRARKKKPDTSLDIENENGRSLAETIPGKDHNPLSTVTESELKEQIAKAVSMLPENQKETFIMRVESGLSFKEIAKIQKISINTALARMQYALDKLRPLLRKEYDELR